MMNRSRWEMLVWVIAIASMSVVFRPANTSQSMLDVSYLSIALDAFAGLVGLWASFGRSSPRIRVFGLVLAGTVVVMGLSTFGEWPNYWYLIAEETTHISTIILIKCLLMAVLRIPGVNPAAIHGVTPRAGSMRWTLLDQSLLIAAVAGLLAAVAYLRPLTQDFGKLPIQLTAGLTFGLISTVTAWAITGRWPWFLRLLAIMSVMALGAAIQVFSYKILFRNINNQFYFYTIGSGVLLHVILVSLPIRLYNRHSIASGSDELDGGMQAMIRDRS